MKNITIHLKIDNPKSKDILKQKYSRIAAQIILNKIPPSLLNTFICELEKKLILNSYITHRINHFNNVEKI